MKRKFLIFAPHADDAELGLGGLLYERPHSQIEDVQVVILATGGYDRFDGQQVSGQTRQAEARAGLAILGVDKVIFAREFEENCATEQPFVELVNTIARHVALFQPTDLFVNLPSFNQDHQRVFDAFVTATRPGAFDWVQRIYAYEYPGNAWGPPAPALGKTYVRMGPSALDAKIDAVNAHKSQWEGRPQTHVGPHGAEQLAALRGSECGAQFAELLYLMRGNFQ